MAPKNLLIGYVYSLQTLGFLVMDGVFAVRLAGFRARIPQSAETCVSPAGWLAFWRFSSYIKNAKHSPAGTTINL